MTLTLSTLLDWQPFPLQDAASRIRTTQYVLDDRAQQLCAVAERIGQTWSGEAADAAIGTLRGRASAAMELSQTYGLLSTALGAAAETLVPALRLAEEGRQHAQDHRLVMADDGTVVAPPPTVLASDATMSEVSAASTRHLLLVSAADTAQSMVRQALAVADEIDQDAAAAVRAVRTTMLGGPSWPGMDRALVSAIIRPALPAAGADPHDVAAWWAALSTEARRLVAAQHPELLGGLDGLPAAVRDAANRRVLADLEAGTAADLASVLAAITAVLADPDERATYGTLDQLVLRRDELESTRALLAAVRAQLDGFTGRHLVLLDPEMPGKVAIAIGDVDAAEHVAVLVPGMTALATTYLDGLMNDAQRLVGAADRGGDIVPGRPGLAAIAWIGYTAPTEIDVAFRGKARAGADALRAMLNGVASSHATRGRDVHLTAVGHSYGSLVVGLAVQQPTGAGDVVLMGSPGVDATSAAALAVPDGHVYVAEAPSDMVADAAWFGLDPSAPGFGATMLHTSGGAHPVGGDTVASTGHSEYYKAGSENLWNLVAITTGEPENVTTGGAPDLGDVLRPAADLIPGVWLRDHLR